MKYTVLDLIDALVDRQQSSAIDNPLAEYSRSKAGALERAFGVNIDEHDPEKVRRRVR